MVLCRSNRHRMVLTNYRNSEDSMSTEISEEILASLTDEEREALEELKAMEEGASEDDPEVDLANGEKGGETTTEEEEEEDESNGAGEGGDTGAGAEGGSDDGKTDAGGADNGADGNQPVQPAAPPILVVEAPEGAEDRLKAIDEEITALEKKYDDGEITYAEMRAEERRLNKETLELSLALKEAETAQKIAYQAQVNEREAAINGFLKDVGIPRDMENPEFAALDKAVRVIASLPDAESKTPTQIMKEAFDLAVFKGEIQAKEAPKKEPKQEAKKEPEKPPVKKAIKAPKTIANLPSADVTDTSDGSRWAHINGIKDPDAREAAFMRLSPADQEAYLASGA